MAAGRRQMYWPVHFWILLITCIIVLCETVYTGKYHVALAIAAAPIGALLNLTAIRANNGTMPVLARSSIMERMIVESTAHCVLNKYSRLPLLTDIFVLRRLQTAFSIGDVFCAVGLFATITYTGNCILKLSGPPF